MALAERWLATKFNRPGHEIFNHYTYSIVSDGDLQEGVAAEAASLAGTLGLGKLILIYDDNQISIEGDTDIAFLEDVPRRFEAYGWQVAGSMDGNDLEAVTAAIAEAKAETNKPSLIVCHTVIGYGSPNKAGTAGIHGAPLGDDEVELTRQQLEWPYQSFTVPVEAWEHLGRAKERGRQLQEEWQSALEHYRSSYADEASQLDAVLSGALSPGWSDGMAGLFDDGKAVSTREASGRVMNAIAAAVPNLIGGSADLAPSTLTILNSEGHIGPGNFDGRNLHFGVREHAMGAVCNGIAVHGGAIPFASTFLIFSDYLRPALRLGALMKQQVIYVFTHDSVGLGEDGPTHQPIEHLMSLREMPGLVVIRPADATETAAAWRAALERRDGPTALALSRQNLPVLDHSTGSGSAVCLAPAEGAAKGGYVLWENGSDPQVIIIATGSEVHIALEAAQALMDEGINARLVSMPSWEIFEAQPKEYREAVLPPGNRARVSVEAGATNGWARYVGLDGASHRNVNLRGLCSGGRSSGTVRFHRRAGRRGGPQPGKRSAVVSDLTPGELVSGSPTALERARLALDDLAGRRIPQRIRERDYTVWRPEPREISDRLGWLDAGAFLRPHLAELTAFADRIRDEGYRDVVLLGMGGSCLGPEVLRCSFGSAAGYPNLTVLDSTVPEQVAVVASAIDPAHTLFIVSSKSGGTIETLSFYHYFRGLTEAALPMEEQAAILSPSPTQELRWNGWARKRDFGACS